MIRVPLLALWATAAFAETPRHVYRVKRGQGVGEVAQRTGVSVKELQALNGSGELREGTGLLVPENAKTQALPLYQPPLPAPAWKVCPNVTWTSSRVVSKEPCPQKRCAGEVCATWACDADDVELRLGKESWRAGFFISLESSLLHVAKVDLDGDGAPETVVFYRELFGNGIALEQWQITLFSKGKRLATLSSIDSGDAFIAQEKGCALLVVNTEDREDQLKGLGLYFVAHAHAFDGAGMKPVGPRVYRRYTERFAGQRWESLGRELHPQVPWFTDADAFVWP